MRIISLVCLVALCAPTGLLAQGAPPKSAPAPAPAAAAAPAAKPADGPAEMTTATFGDWQLRCRNAPSATAGQPATKMCEVVQSVVIQGQSAPFAQLAFGKPTPTEPLAFTAVLPTNIALPSTVKIAVDEADKQPVELAWTRCLPGGCFATTAAKDDILKRWRPLNEGGRFTFKSAAGQEVTIPFSFRGLSRALDALAKEG